MTPDSHPFNAVYVLAAVGWTILGVLLLVVAAKGWQRVERRIHAKHAVVVPLYPVEARVYELPRRGAS